MLLSPYPAERVAAEAQTRLGAHLSAKGFALVAAGPSGLTWRRELGGKVLAGLVVLAFMAIGWIGTGSTDGEPGLVAAGVACAIAAGALLRVRRPGTVVVVVHPSLAGCEIELHSSVNVAGLDLVLRATANASPEPAADWSVHEAKSAYFAGRIDADEFESAISDALDRDS